MVVYGNLRALGGGLGSLLCKELASIHLRAQDLPAIKFRKEKKEKGKKAPPRWSSDRKS